MSDVNSVTESDASSIADEEDTTVGAEALAARPAPRSRRRRRRRLSQQVQRQVARSNLMRVLLSVVLGLGVVAASTYLARVSANVDIPVVRYR